MEDSAEGPAEKTVVLGTFVVSCACATLGLMVSLCFLIFHVYHRNNKIVRMSSPYMNMVTSFGGIALSVVCFLYGLEFIFDRKTDPLTVLCKIRLWVLIPSVTLVFGPAATKSWRVYEIFKYGLAKKVVIKDRRLFLILFGLLVVDMILMTLWQTIDPVTVKDKWYEEKNMDTNESSNQTSIFSYLIQECACAKLEVWVAVITLWKVTLIAACLFYAWKIRSVPIPSLNDSSYTFAAIFVSVILAFSAAMVTIAIRSHPNAVYVITCVGLAMVVIFVQIVLFLPKVRNWWKTPENASPRISASPIRKTSVDPQIPRDLVGDINGNMYPDDGLLDIVEENKALKVSLLEKEELIFALQKHLNSAKEKISMFPTDIKQDSSFDLVLDSGSADELYETLRAVDNVTDRSTLYRVELTPRSERNDETEPSKPEVALRKPKLKHTQSLSASSRHSFVEEFTDIRRSVVDELNSATSINTELQKSMSRDLDRPYSETEWLYESREPKELAGSIAKSYDLGEDQEVFSHIHTYLPLENSVFQVRKTKRTSASSVISWQSVENVSIRSTEPDTISCEVTSASRDSATPNSQQHAAILRYYSYRHINDGFKRFQNSFKFNRDLNPQHSVSSANTLSSDTEVKLPADSQINIYSVPHVHRQIQQVETKLGAPRDSFV